MTTRPTLSLFAAALALPALGAAASAAQPASKTFRNWVAGCDNLLGCTALSLPADNAENVAFLKLERPGGAQAAPKLSLRVRGEKLKAPLPVSLSLDGAPFPTGGKALQASITDEENAELLLPPAEMEALIAAARKATKLTATAAGKRYEISLSGSVAAMLWIDEQQGRLDTTSALIRKGAATAVPPPPIVPVILARPTNGQPALDAKATKALTTALRQHLKKTQPDACDDGDETAAQADTAWPLTGNLRLVGLLCSRGAYNETTGFWTVPGTDVAKASSVAFPQVGGASDNQLTNAAYQAKTGRIEYFAKARGLGDCGAAGGYAWTGSAFVMTSLSEMGECRGIGPEDWPVLFRSDVKAGK